MFKNLSLRKQLFAVIVLVSVLAMLAAGAILFISEIARTRDAILGEMTSLARLLGDRSSAALAFADDKTARENLAALSPLEQVGSACLFDERGTVLAGFSRGKTSAQVCQVLQPIQTNFYGFMGVTAYVQMPVIASDSLVGAIQVNSTATQLIERLTAQTMSLCVAMACAIVLAAILALRLQRVISAPLARVSDVANEIVNSGNYSLRAPNLGQNELGELAATFNRMLVTIETQNYSLAENEAYARRLFYDSPVPQMVADPVSMTYVDCNNAAVAIHGCANRDELIGKSSLDVAAPTQLDGKDVDSAIREVMASARKAGIHQYEWRYRRADGTVWDALVNSMLFSLKDRELLHIVMQDITERKRAQAALQESEELYRTLIERSPEAIAVHHAGRFLYFNPAANSMLGATPDNNLVGKPVLDLVHPDSRQFVMARIATLAEHGGSTPMAEMKFIRMDGATINVEAQGTQIVHGVDSTTYVTWRDITARQQAEAAHALLEAQLRESQKMEAIGTLAGGIAHDFNNIVAAILGNTELARQDASANPAILQSLEQIRKAGTRARDLVQQILSFSRRQPTEFKVIELSPIVEESMRLLRATLPPRLLLESHCDPELPCVRADATQIQQILINLATNAMQSMPDRPGHVEIRVDAVTLDAAMVATHPVLEALRKKYPGRVVRVAVSDDGAGMDTATIERVFEPFFTTKGVEGGTGLGLSVVHGIVKAHEGAIEVTSQPGKGTRFTIYLPAAEAEAGAPAQGGGAESANLALGDGQHILYLDDDESLVFLVTRLLERRGLRVSGYLRQDEALAALRADPGAFDLVVSDYNMPGMSGLDVAREVRAIRDDLPVAIASGFIDENLQAQAASAGARELIFKATVVEDLCDAVQRLLPRRH
jgi:PAS domain S-box-containing protein